MDPIICFSIFLNLAPLDHLKCLRQYQQKHSFSYVSPSSYLLKHDPLDVYLMQAAEQNQDGGITKTQILSHVKATQGQIVSIDCFFVNQNLLAHGYFAEFNPQDSLVLTKPNKAWSVVENSLQEAPTENLSCINPSRSEIH